MRRVFWVALGATVGVLVVRRATRAAERFTPEGAADRVSAGLGQVAESVRAFTDEVRAGMADRDAELRNALGIAEANGAGAGSNGVADVEAIDDLFRTTPRGTH